MSVPFRRPFSEGSVVLEHAPDPKGEAAGDDHEGLGMLVALLPETAIDAMEILVLAIDRERGQIQRLTQVSSVNYKFPLTTIIIPVNQVVADQPSRLIGILLSPAVQETQSR